MSNMDEIFPTPILKLDDKTCPFLYAKREDMIPYSFGGNKARKAMKFFEDIDNGDYDTVVTYGSSHSNHCRVVANMAAGRNMKCVLIGPSEVSDTTYNSRMMELFGAEMITVPVDEVKVTIDNTLNKLKNEGRNPYFIPGGGHGNTGTGAYVDCYNEILDYENRNNLKFDYIFFASGTGTTHAGLVCGQLLNGDDRKIVGISIARKNPRGRDVVLDSIREYMDEFGRTLKKQMSGEKFESLIQEKTEFNDEYTGAGYGLQNPEITRIIKESMIRYGMPLDGTYTGKAFSGMMDYIKKNHIENKTILFIHTGGTPLFFDDLDKLAI